jgi:hypothetical protein
MKKWFRGPTDPQPFKTGIEAYETAYKLGPRPTELDFEALRDVYNSNPSVKGKSTASLPQIFDVSYLGGVS